MNVVPTLKRKHPRIPYTGKVDVRFNDRTFADCKAQNLSLVGIWIIGCPEQKKGSLCEVEFHDAAPTANRPLRLNGEIVRVDNGGIALLFTDINLRIYGDLQSLIKEKGGDDSLYPDEFADDLQEH